MSMLVHVATYGDRNGAHVLLAKTAADASPFRELMAYTDKAGNPPLEVFWEPYVSGYPFEHYYIISKTFPDPTASRLGMVFTYALVMDREAASQLPDLSVLLRALPETLDRAAEITPLMVPPSQIERSIGDGEPAERASRFSSVAHALLTEQRQSRPVVWAGQAGFEAVVSVLWTHLWPAARMAFRFRLSFGPQDAEKQDLTLVTTPARLESRWAGYSVIRQTDIRQAQSKAEAFLLGLPEAAPLHTLILDLEAWPMKLADLAKLETCVDYLNADAERVTAEETRSVARLFGYLSPDPAKGGKIKDIVIRRLAEMTAQGPAKDIKGLRNFDDTPFPHAKAALGAAIADWIDAHFRTHSHRMGREIAEMIDGALRNASSQWDEMVRAAASATLAAWDIEVAHTVWECWRAQPALVSPMTSMIPWQAMVERDLTACCPPHLSDTLGESVRAFAQDRMWLLLHAAAVSAYCEPAVAVARQLQLDTKQDHEEGLRLLIERTPAQSMMDIAVHVADARLERLAGELCARSPELLQRIDVTNPTWRRIWCYSVETSGSLFYGVPHPDHIAKLLLDMVFQRQEVEPRLLRELAATQYGDLTEHPQRRDLWDRMEPKVVSMFLAVTANGWLERFRANSQLDLSVESRLEDAILEADRLRTALHSDGPHAVSFGIDLFQRFIRLTERQWTDWLAWLVSAGVAVSSFEATLLGRLTLVRHWHQAVEHIADYIDRDRREDLIPALNECLSLLPFLDYLRWVFSGKVASRTISWKDWWIAFAELAAELYPHGPSDQSIWRRAGGDAAVLERHDTGHAQWDQALDKLRKGVGGGKNFHTESLFSTMERDYPNSTKLRMMRAIFYSLPQ